MKTKEPVTLKEAVTMLSGLAKDMGRLMRALDEEWGIDANLCMIYAGKKRTDVNIGIRRGIEEIEEAFEKEAKFNDQTLCTARKDLKVSGIEFTQYADARTMQFTKAFAKKPNVRIVSGGTGVQSDEEQFSTL